MSAVFSKLHRSALMATSPQAPPPTAKLLIVDDDAAFRQVLGKFLARAGYQLASAADGQEALELLERESYDLVLLDLWMPRMNGLEFLAELQRRWVLPKVVVMSADPAPETLLQAVREQAYLYITKPFELPDLLALVQDVLASPAAVASIEVLSAKPEWVELLVPCQKEVADRLQGFLERLDTNLPEEIRRSVATAFRELLLNAIEWGGKLDPRSKVRIAVLRTKGMLLYRIADPGAGFRPESLDHSLLGNPPEDPLRHVDVREQKGLRPGGFGIAVAKGLVDELIYNEARNEVVLIKYLTE